MADYITCIKQFKFKFKSSTQFSPKGSVTSDYVRRNNCYNLDWNEISVFFLQKQNQILIVWESLSWIPHLKPPGFLCKDSDVLLSLHLFALFDCTLSFFSIVGKQLKKSENVTTISKKLKADKNQDMPSQNMSLWCQIKKRNKKERTWLLLGMKKEKVYYTHVGKHSQRLGHLGESRVVTTLNPVRRRGEKGTKYSSQEAQEQKRDR